MSAERSPAINIVKCRDDHHPVTFRRCKHPDDKSLPYTLADDASCSWIGPNESFGPPKIRHRVEPWLTALCQSEHLSLLLGSGLGHAIHDLAKNEELPGMAWGDFGSFDDVINPEVERSAAASGRERGNIEDQIRVANELLRGQEILAVKHPNAKARADALRAKIDDVLGAFADGIRKGEHGVISANKEKREETFSYLVSFLMSFASGAGTRERLHIFTTNYDRFIEAGADAAGLHLLDRFVGSIAPLFRSSRLDLDIHYNPPGIRGEPRYLEGVARFTKLHGSLDWFDCDRSIRRLLIPFGAESIQPYLAVPWLADGDATRLMIYPNSAKDRETASYPYIELFRDFAAAACRPNHALFTYGYSFGDEHLNRVIEDMLTIPSTHLVVISYNDPLGRIMKTYEKLGRHPQITLLIGDEIGKFKSLVDYYLPKSAIDRTTFRMAELLKARWGASQDGVTAAADPSAESEGGDE